MHSVYLVLKVFIVTTMFLSQVQIFEEDFKAEREDRERAHSQRNEQEEKFKKEVMRLQSELEHTRRQLSSHKGNLSGLENIHKERNTEWMHTMDELKKAQEEIRAKTSQVKQYKKQLDSVTAKVKCSVCVHEWCVHLKCMYG